MNIKKCAENMGLESSSALIVLVPQIVLVEHWVILRGEQRGKKKITE